MSWTKPLKLAGKFVGTFTVEVVKAFDVLGIGGFMEEFERESGDVPKKNKARNTKASERKPSRYETIEMQQLRTVEAPACGFDLVDVPYGTSTTYEKHTGEVVDVTEVLVVTGENFLKAKLDALDLMRFDDQIGERCQGWVPLRWLKDVLLETYKPVRDDSLSVNASFIVQGAPESCPLGVCVNVMRVMVSNGDVPSHVRTASVEMYYRPDGKPGMATIREADEVYLFAGGKALPIKTEFQAFLADGGKGLEIDRIERIDGEKGASLVYKKVSNWLGEGRDDGRQED